MYSLAIKFVVLALQAAPLVAGQHTNSLQPRQSTDGLPSCTRTCYETAKADSNSRPSCDASDVRCLCVNEVFKASVARCFHNSCTARDVPDSGAWFARTCTAAGVAGVASAIDSFASNISGTGSNPKPNSGSSSSNITSNPKPNSGSSSSNITSDPSSAPANASNTASMLAMSLSMIALSIFASFAGTVAFASMHG